MGEVSRNREGDNESGDATHKAIQDAFERLLGDGSLIAILRGLTPDATISLALELRSLGVRHIEVTIQDEQGAQALRQTVQVWPDGPHMIGAGSVTSASLARQAIDDVRERGKTALVVGGSGLYVRAVLEKLDFPGTDPNARARWETRLSEVGAPALHDELHAIDPDAAQAIERNNGRRIVRALEVIELTGEPFVARLPPPEDVYPVHRFGVHIDRERLDTRIEDRVDAMWKDGFVDEVRRLEAGGFRDASTAAAALGYGPVLDFLAGEYSEEQARQRTVDDTRKFARRQQRWFLRDERIEWRDHDDADFVDAIAGRVARP